jgi:hypothetical protein
MSPHRGVGQGPRALPVGLHERGSGLLKREKLGLMENKKGRAISDPAFSISQLNRDLFFDLLFKS